MVWAEQNIFFHSLAVYISHHKPDQKRSAVITVSAFGLILFGMIHFSLYCSLFQDRFNHSLYLYCISPWDILVQRTIPSK